jgi:hypothetical protein
MRPKHVRLRTSVILYTIIMLEGGDMINEVTEVGENDIMRFFINYTVHQISGQ